MSWFFVKNHATSAAEKLQGNPWEFENGRPDFGGDKTKFRKWCKKDTTEHCFYTGFEGVNPHLRVETENNPALKQWGWVVDYDFADGDIEELKTQIKAELPADLWPTAVSLTFSGGARIVWEFDDYVWADQPEVHSSFLKKLAMLVKAKRLAPGMDEASFSVTTTWELGSEWSVIGNGNKLKKETLTKLLFEACRAVKAIKSDYAELPWDIIQDQIEKMYPGRLDGLTVGRDVRVPLFWIDDNNSDQSGICAEWGVYSFSSRADQGLTFWPDLLGKDFMRQFEEKRLSVAVDHSHFDGSGYWVTNSHDVWSARTKDDFTQDLKVRGFSHRMKKKATCTEVDEIIATVRDRHQIVAAAPFTHTREPFITHNGDKYLNINHKFPMQPAAKEECVEENFTWVISLLDGFFEEVKQNGESPLDYWLADMQRTLQHLHGGDAVSGKAEILAGSTNLGKSLMSLKIKRLLFGSNTDGGKFLLEQNAFNRELAESFHWYIDDNQSASSQQRHMLFTETLKKHIASPEVLYHPKFKDSRVIPWYGRITITCNDDPDSLSIIPNMDLSIKDKVSLYKLNKRNFPFPSNAEVHEILMRELPYFVGWLLWHYVPPTAVLDTDNRYGVLPYHHPELLQTAKEVTGHARLEEILDIWRELTADPSEKTEWVGTSAALLAQMNVHEGLRSVLRTYSPTNFTRALNKLQKEGSCSFMKGAQVGRRFIWTVQLPKKPA